MRFSTEALTKRAVVITTLVVLGGCANSDPDVPAKLREEVQISIADERITLGVGTRVLADCRADPFTMAVEITGGEYSGVNVKIPITALEATADPYGALQQTPAQDPFGPLPNC